MIPDFLTRIHKTCFHLKNIPMAKIPLVKIHLESIHRESIRLTKNGLSYACYALICLLLAACAPASQSLKTVNASGGKTSTKLTVSAASSLSGILPDLVVKYRATHSLVEITLNFGASGSLRRQIEEGAAVDLFLSASAEQMDVLENKAMLSDETRRNLLKNEVVVVMPAGKGLPVESTGPREISSDGGPATALGKEGMPNPLQCLEPANIQKIGIGEPGSVPAGAYAWAALGDMDQLENLTPKLVYAKNVREALTWVETGNLDAAFVFRTDALSSEQVEIVAVLPEAMTGPIAYPVAVLAESAEKEAALAFLCWLDGDEAWPDFERAGFVRVE